MLKVFFSLEVAIRLHEGETNLCSFLYCCAFPICLIVVRKKNYYKTLVQFGFTVFQVTFECNCDIRFFFVISLSSFLALRIRVRGLNLAHPINFIDLFFKVRLDIVTIKKSLQEKSYIMFCISKNTLTFYVVQPKIHCWCKVERFLNSPMNLSIMNWLHFCILLSTADIVTSVIWNYLKYILSIGKFPLIVVNKIYILRWQ